MTIQIATVLAILVLTIVLMAAELWPVEVVALLVVVTLVFTKIITPEQALDGFGDASLVMIASVLVMTAGIVHTGVANRLGLWIGQISGRSALRFFIFNLLGIAFLSAFINNVAATAIFVPIVMSVARRKKWSPAQFLMPLAFGSILGGTCTLIGTSTNVAISSALTKYQLAPFGIFEFAPIGVPIACGGILYLVLVGRRWIPDRTQADLAQQYHVKEFLTEIVVPPASKLAGKTVNECELQLRFEVNLVGVVREGGSILAPHPRQEIRAHDLLLLEGKLENILHLKEAANVEIRAERAGGLDLDKVQMREVLIAPRSELIGQTLKESQFRQRYGLNVLAIYRQGESLIDKPGRIRLEAGDTLLVQGEDDRVGSLGVHQDLILLGGAPVPAYRRRKAGLAIIILVLSIAASAAGVLPVVFCFLLGATLMVLTGCLSTQQAYEHIDWRVLLLIAGMSSLGVAMKSSGAAGFVAALLHSLTAGLPPLALLAALFWITVLLTQPLSNAAAGLLALPIALAAAEAGGKNPRGFAMMVSIAASISVMTPFEPACLLVYGPGKYQFLDFVKNGAVVTVIAFIISLTLVPLLWPL